MGKGRSAIDEVDNVNASTPLMVACETLADLELVRILVEEGGADVNSVNSDDKMPLSILKERIEKHTGSAEQLLKLTAMYEYMEAKGAKLTWRDKRR